jgi:uncharacterized metal-binding protein
MIDFIKYTFSKKFFSDYWRIRKCIALSKNERFKKIKIVFNVKTDNEARSIENRLTYGFFIYLFSFSLIVLIFIYILEL